MSTSSYVLSAVRRWHLMTTIFSVLSFSGVLRLTVGVLDVVEMEIMEESLLVDERVDDLDLMEEREPILERVMGRWERGESSVGGTGEYC